VTLTYLDPSHCVSSIHDRSATPLSVVEALALPLKTIAAPIEQAPSPFLTDADRLEDLEKRGRWRQKVAVEPEIEGSTAEERLLAAPNAAQNAAPNVVQNERDQAVEALAAMLEDEDEEEEDVEKGWRESVY
jgi:hypothetical protein